MTTRPQPPKHLSPTARAWWREVVNTFEIEPHSLPTLTLAATALDRAEQARTALADGALTLKDRFGNARARPEIAIERNAMIAFARLTRELGLDAGEEAPRPLPLRGQR